MRIELKDISYSYNRGRVDEVPALNGVNALFQSGEIVAVLGREGSGKSTLLQQLNGLLMPTRGQVLIDGELLTVRRAASLRSRIAMAFQYPEHQLFAPTVFAEIAFAVRRQSLVVSEVEQRVYEAADMVGLDLAALGDRRPLELSGSERRRVAIASALVTRPALFLLDEPLSGLDSTARRHFMSMLQRLRTDSNMGVVLVSHSLEDALSVADRLIVMDQGTVAFDGGPETLLLEGEALERWGLKLPLTLQLIALLRQNGLEIPPSVWQVPDVVAAIRKAREGIKPVQQGAIR